MCFGKDHPYKSLQTSIKHNNQEHIYYDVSQLDPHLFCKLRNEIFVLFYYEILFLSFSTITFLSSNFT
jgi:hypothetical protein